MAGLVVEWETVFLLVLVFTRIMALFLVAPVFRGRNMPTLVKGALALLMALLLAAGLDLPTELPISVWALSVLLAQEAAIGITLGFFVQLFFFAVGAAGQLIDTEMGFHMANILDPASETQLPLIGNLFSTISVLLYLSLEGHLLLFKALFVSYDLFAPGRFVFTSGAGLLLESSARLLPLAVQIALPVMGASLFTGFMFGIMAKAVPQMNVFIIGMPLKIVLLSIVLVAALPGLIYLMENRLGSVFLDLADWLMSGSLP